MGGKKVYFRLRRRRAMKQMKQILPTESQEQIEFIQWADMFFNGNDEFVFAIPNGGLRNVVVAKKMKAEGVKAGVPDLFFTLSRGGYKVDICKGFDEAKKSILEYVQMRGV